MSDLVQLKIPDRYHNQEETVVLGIEDLLYLDNEQYLLLQTVKDFYTEFNTTTTNPFETVGQGLFSNRAATKLAVIDLVYHLTDYHTSQASYIFADVAGGPGSFTEYLFAKVPDSKGIGITLKSLDWYPELLKLKEFTAIYGPDKTGDLYTNWQYFVTTVLATYKLGVDLVVADGGFDIGSNYKEQEELSFRLILLEALVAIKILKVGSHLVLKVFDTVNTNTVMLIYLLSHCFKYISFYKPITSRPANAEKYLICEALLPPNTTVSKLLESMLVSISNIILPKDFITWLVANNNYYTQLQLAAGYKILTNTTTKLNPASKELLRQVNSQLAAIASRPGVKKFLHH